MNLLKTSRQLTFTASRLSLGNLSAPGLPNKLSSPSHFNPTPSSSSPSFCTSSSFSTLSSSSSSSVSAFAAAPARFFSTTAVASGAPTVAAQKAAASPSPITAAPVASVSPSLTDVNGEVVDPAMLKQATRSSFVSRTVDRLKKAAWIVKDLRQQQVAQEGFALIESEMSKLNNNINVLLSTDIPVLEEIARYYFSLHGKRLRPALVLLMSQSIDRHLQKSPSYRREVNGGSIHLTELNGLDSLEGYDSVAAKQIRLAEIVEMIHTASIVHDDVIDDAVARRGKPSINIAYSNKLSILCGDFLLSRASLSLARLRNHEVTFLMSTTISELVEGEFMQMDGDGSRFDNYMRKTYLKTASLISNSCASAAILAGADRPIVDLARQYGEHLGLAFQLIDDLLDISESTETLGKEAAVDMRLGLATAPVLFARDEFPELNVLINRRFQEENDVERARQLVLQSNGLAKTKELAKHHCARAVDAISQLSDSPARTVLTQVTEQVWNRSK